MKADRIIMPSFEKKSIKYLMRTALTIVCVVTLCGCSKKSTIVSETSEASDTEVSVSENASLEQEVEALKTSQQENESKFEQIYSAYSDLQSQNEYLSEQYSYLAGILSQIVQNYPEIASQYSLSGETSSETTATAATQEDPYAAYYTGITYDDLADTSKDLTGQLVILSGRIVSARVVNGTTVFEIAESGDVSRLFIAQGAQDFVDAGLVFGGYVTVCGQAAGMVDTVDLNDQAIKIPRIYIDAAQGM